MGTPGTTSLRERSKRRRRAAIQRAAMELFARRGYDATTVADIAAAAEVAPRTVSLYFPSKADLALSEVNAAAERLTESLRDVRDERSAMAAFSDWLDSDQQADDPDLALLQARMLDANPGLRALRTAQIDTALESGTAAIAAALDVSPDHHLVPLLRGAMLGLLHEYPVARAAAPPGAAHAAVVAFLQAGLQAVRPH